MADEREEVTPRTLGRWLVVWALLLVGLVLYFVAGQDTGPMVEPPTLGATE